jgi:dihydropyrimidinase
MRILVRGGTLVSDGRSRAGDVLVEGETIAAAGDGAVAPAAVDRVLDASGCQVFPGGVDPHVHLELQTGAGRSADDFVSGTRAALAGGTTAVIDFVTPGRDEPLADALAARLQAAGRSACDYLLHMSVTSWRDTMPAELEACRRDAGIVSVKAYLAYRETIGIPDREFLALLDAARRLRLLTLVHAESGDMVRYLQLRLLAAGRRSAAHHPESRPPEVEADAAGRALLMARLAGAPLYIVHVSTRQAIEAVAAARRAGQIAIAETCPQYLLLDEALYRGDAEAAAEAVMSPPLRSAEHRQALWQALAEGTVQALGTDHCPFDREAKRRHAADDFTRIPGGSGGVEYRLSLLFTYGVAAGRITPERFVDLVSTRPAKLFGLYPRKGTLRPGSDADLVVWDPGTRWTAGAAGQHQRGGSTLYEGLELQGAPRFVLSRGETVLQEGRLEAEAGRGRWLGRGGGADGR